MTRSGMVFVLAIGSMLLIGAGGGLPGQLEALRDEVAALRAEVTELRAGLPTATPVTSCGIIDEPGPYVLTSHLEATGDCLEIVADHVTLDLGGFTIRGPGDGTGIAIESIGRGTVVRNGAIEGFEFGVWLRDASTVEDLRVLDIEEVAIIGGAQTHVHDVASGPILVDHGSVVTTSRVVGSPGGYDGINLGNKSVAIGNTAEGSAIGIHAFFSAVVLGNAVGDNETGIRAGASSVIGNSSTHNAGAGIESSAAATLLGNSATENSGPGFDARSGSILIGNGSSFNDDGGMSVQCPANLTVNVSSQNTPDNLSFVTGSSTCLVEHNLAP